MEKEDFPGLRGLLGKAQQQLVRLLCVSPKAMQSFKQGWRRVPIYIERETLLLMALKKSVDRDLPPCWEFKDCPQEWKNNCTIWELKTKNIYLFINGTYCQGSMQETWGKKIKICRECEVYQTMVPADFA